MGMGRQGLWLINFWGKVNDEDEKKKRWQGYE
jgi:hypothetical protein